MLHARARRLTAWIALAVMLLGALAPTVSHALARAAGAAPSLLDLCTVAGPRPLASEAATQATPDASFVAHSPAGPESAFSLDHCPFCLPIADRLGPPPAASMHFFNAESGLARPDAQALFFEAFAPPSALPRGPPTFS